MKQFFLKSFIIIFSLFFSHSIFAQSSVIKGKVLNNNSRSGLAGAFVSLKNTSFKTITSNDGYFELRNVSAGKFEIVVEYIGFSSLTKNIEVKPATTSELNFSLIQQSEELQKVTVFGRLNRETESSSRISEKNANNITNVISARAMERSPDINAANVLQRMSGVTLQTNSGADEAYAIVRGLEPRYNNTLINGVKIASPDEKSRFVSLNVVPSDLLQRIEVSKSLIPEMEGDAIGGTVNLVMKDAPDSVLLKAIGSVGYSNIFFDRKYVSFSKKDIQQKSLYDRKGSAYTAQPGDFSRSNLDFKKITAIPTGILGITYGKRFLGNKLGFLIAENFQNQYYGTNSQYNQAVPDIYQNKPAISDVADRRISTQQLNNGLTLHLDYNVNDRNKITLTNVFLYSSLAQAREIIDTAIKGGAGGRTVPGSGPITNDYLSITDHQVIENLKLEGKHILTEHFLFDWAGVFSTASKRTPDRADLNINTKIDTLHTTNDIKGPYKFVQTPYYFDDISRIWQHNNDKDYNALANLTYRAKIKDFLLELKTGGLYRHKTRYNLQDEYILKPVANNTNGVKQQFDNVNTAQWIVYDTKGTQQYDINNYKLFENITAGYGQAKLSAKYFDLFGGVRVEKTEQGYTLNTFYSTGINAVTKNYTDVLPSIMFKYKLNKKTNIRLSYFKSISRPNYYELVPATLLSSSSPTAETGNPELKHSIANNFDIRYELFPREEEQLFIGGFYKKIKDPIEYAYQSIETYKPENLGTATVYGGEIVYTKYFGNIGMTGNYTYIYSKILSPKFYTDVVAQTTVSRLQKRPLQGQTNNSINYSLLYRNNKQKVFVQLAYQYVGKTLARVYSVYGYDYYQTPQSFLALSAEKQLFNRHFTVFGKFNNLLNTATVNKINNLLVAKDTYKANFSIGFRYSN